MPSTTSTHRRRHSKQPSFSSKKSAPSILSITSHESTSSNATARPFSIFPSSLRPSKRPGAKKDAPLERPRREDERSNNVEIEASSQENVDVFAFMQNSEDSSEGSEEESDDSEDGKVEAAEKHQEASSPTSSSASSMHQPQRSPRFRDMPQRSPRYSDLEVRAIQNGAPHTWGRASLHSDSGISDMRSSSPDPESPVLQHKLPKVFDKPNVEVNSPYEGAYGILEKSPHLSPQRGDIYSHKHWPSLEMSQGPETCYPPSPPQLTQTPHNTSYLTPETYARPAKQLARSTSHLEGSQTRVIQSGYDLLSSNIDSHNPAFLKPIYRKFEMLNNRMLLYLQDEIAEMEEQLTELDNAIAHEEQNMGQRPASRRAEAKLPSQLQWHRMELLGRSFAKIEQYNRALTSYAKLTKNLSPASHADISAYRSWISEHAPVVEQEAAYLQRANDLVTVSPQSVTTTKPSTDFRTGSALQTPVIVVAFGLLSTIIVFKVVPQIPARLVISAMVGIAALCTLSPEVMTNVTCVKDWTKAIATYSAIMAMLAVVVS